MGVGVLAVDVAWRCQKRGLVHVDRAESIIILVRVTILKASSKSL
jgi:hypothetical protein